MKTSNRIVASRLLSFVLVFAIPSIGTGQSKVATTAGQFLGISVGPRAIAMGSAYVASNDDATALYWNPGAFQKNAQSQLVLSTTGWLVDTDFRWAGFQYALDGENSIGLSLTQLDYGEDEVTTVTEPTGTGERWSAQDLSVGLSYCRRLTDRFSMGGTVKWVEQRVYNESANSVAFDLGLLFITDFNDLRLGVSMTNFGGDLKLEGSDLLTPVDIDPSNSGSNKSLVGSMKTDAWPLPLTFRVGVAMEAYQDNQFRVTVAADAILPNDNEAAINGGGEIGWSDLLFVRGGYKSIVGGETEESLSLGAGLKYTLEGFATLRVDYAWTDFGVFGNLSTFALGIGF
jgi:opacity protein-like surface antigen